jgi:glycosyltransferase involved in cell wall biosynthesis
MRVLRLCSVFEAPDSALSGRGARCDPVGGMQEHTGSLTRALDGRGVVQVLLTARPPTAPWVERLTPTTTVVRVSLPVRRPRRLYSLPAAVLAPILGRDADLVHVHLGEDLAILPLAALAARARRLPIVLTIHCSLAHTLEVTDVRGAVLHWLGGRIERHGQRRAATTIVYTRRAAERIAPDARRVLVMNRGVRREPFAHPGADPFPQLRGRPRVVFLGRITLQKGVDTLVEAAAQLRAPGVQVVLVGDGPARERIERRIRQLRIGDRVHIAGFIAHERVPAVLAAADVLVLPSVYEELGTVLVEALHAGLPVVAARVGGIPAVVEDGVTGLLVAPRDPGALAAAIDRVLGDRELAFRLGAAAAQRAADYDLDRVAAQVHDIYSELAAAGRARSARSIWPA